MRIGLLEDDLNQIELIKFWTQEVGDELKSYTSGKSFRKALDSEYFDVLILDWHLPDTSGIRELDWLRNDRHFNMPVLFITSRDSEASVVEALEHGANDYMIKPVSKMITLARIKALYRYSKNVILHTNNQYPEAPLEANTTRLVFKPFNINRLEKRISVNDKVVKLTNKEFELAAFMFDNIGSLITRETLMDVIWGTQADLNTRTVDTHISRIRAKLGIKPAIGWQLKSIYQRGYRLTQVSEI